MSYSYLNQPVLASLLCFQLDNDSFFSPEANGHTGFAFDGCQYAGGVKGTAQASWATEGQSVDRGPLATFPTAALILVSRASVAILDATQTNTPLWMLFYLSDVYGYVDNVAGGEAGYLAKDVSWGNGTLTITMQPDAGALPQSPTVLNISFVADGFSVDTHG